MKLKVLGSSSSGNCYILESDTEALIIEAGLPFMEVKKALNFNVRKIVGVVVSHSHGDHVDPDSILNAIRAPLLSYSIAICVTDALL